MTAPGAAGALQIPIGAFRLDLEGQLEGRYVQRIESETPREDPEGKLRLRIGSDLTSRFRLQTALTGIAGGLPRRPARSGVFDLEDAIQDLSPSLDVEEAYLDAYFESLDIRAGLQKFAWGKLDGLQPNDILNPEKMYDPILEEENDRKIGIPAVSTTVYLPSSGASFLPESLRLTGVWAPIVTPFRFPDQDERWYPPIARVPEVTESDGFTVRNESRVRNAQAPERDLRNSAGAGRLAGFFRGADFAFYYYDGYDTAPSLEVSAAGFVRYRVTEPGCTPDDPDCFDVRSEIDIFPIFQRIRAAGADLAYNFLGATIRAEGAYVMDRLYPRAIRDIVARQEVGTIDQILILTGQEQPVDIEIVPVNVKRDAVEWGFGGDYLFPGNTFFLAQMNQTAVLDNDVDLLISDTETRIATTVRRSFFADRLEAELIGFYGVQSVYGMAHARLTYDFNDYVELRIGYVLLEGHEESILGQYAPNDQAYSRLRLSF